MKNKKLCTYMAVKFTQVQPASAELWFLTCFWRIITRILSNFVLKLLETV